jgi:hypothetical protein
MKLPKINVKKENICSFASKLSFVLFVVSILTQVFITNKYAVKGSEMVFLQEQKDSIEAHISSLELEASQLASLSLLESRADELGFIKYDAPLTVISSAKLAAVR